MRFCVRGILLIFVLGVTATLRAASADSAGADAWTRLRVGMTRNEATAVVGSALVMSSGRGFDIGVYDGRAEVVFHHGRLVAWTAPATGTQPATQVNALKFTAERQASPSPEKARRRPGAVPQYRL